jgi:hypothetical protein
VAGTVAVVRSNPVKVNQSDSVHFPGSATVPVACGASRAALSGKDVFGGTPNSARETHALPSTSTDSGQFGVIPTNSDQKM